MSTRLWLTACDLKQINSYFGSKDPALQKKLLKELDEWLPDEDDEEDEDEDSEEPNPVEAARERIKSALNEGVSKSGTEGPGEVSAAYVIAQHAKAKPQPWQIGDEEEWAWRDLYELQEQFKKRLDQKTSNMLNLILEGRGLFGNRFGGDCGWYAYLTNAEVKEFAAGLSKSHAEACKLMDSGALNEIDFDSRTLDVTEHMIKTLSRIEGQDLFIYAS